MVDGPASDVLLELVPIQSSDYLVLRIGTTVVSQTHHIVNDGGRYCNLTG
jgi:hypothetical protein